jgi:hypothetical protein
MFFSSNKFELEKKNLTTTTNENLHALKYLVC